MPRSAAPTPATSDKQATTLPYLQSIAGCLDDAIGKHGLSDRLYDRYTGLLSEELARMKTKYRGRALAILRIAEDTQDIDDAAAALAQLSKGAETIVFFGTGGSGLGGQTLAQFGGWNIPGVCPKPAKGRPRVRFYDNLDGNTLGSALKSLDLAATRFVVTSKSGGTSETLAQAIATLDAVKAAGLADKIPTLFLGITEPAKKGKPNGLRALFEDLGIPLLDHHTGIGGRFSCLTNVGLLPAMARGLDAHEIRAGARAVVDAMMAAKTPRDFAPCVGAAVAIALSKEKKVRTLVLMPYADRLARLADWYVQLWAESLGKNGEGTSPIGALGPLDQHSQLQLFMDGPRELFITIVRTATVGEGPKIDPAMAKTAGIGFMGGRAIGDVVDAQSHAVVDALREAGRPVRTFDLADMNERTIGALLMHFMLETIFAGSLLGIDPFDQPAVELAKKLTKERLA
jgi:glucose-6-phosphate isomerase